MTPEAFWQKAQAAARVGLAITAVGLLASCDKHSADPYQANAPHDPTPTPLRPLNAETAAEDAPILAAYYPELKANGVRLHQHGIISGSAVPTTIDNFTNYTLNEQSAAALYEYIDNLVAGGLVQATIRGQDGNPQHFRLEPLADVQERTIVIVPGGTPRPSWPFKVDLTPHRSATLRDAATGQAFSYVEAGEVPDDAPFTTPQAQATLGMAIEACLQVANARLFDASNNVQIDDSQARFLEGHLCASIGVLLTARFLNLPYDTYAQETQKRTAGDLGGSRRLRLARFSQQTYESIKPLGVVIE